MMFEHISQMHLDALKEVGNIGTGHAATALSSLLNRKIKISIPSVRLEPINSYINGFDRPESVVYAICQYFSGDINGCIFFVLPKETANYFLQSLFNNPDFDMNNPDYTAEGKSALREFGNILSGNYLSSFSNLAGLQFKLSTPIVVTDMISTIITEGILLASLEGDNAFIIEAILHGEQNHLESDIFFLPTHESFQTIFSALGI